MLLWKELFPLSGCKSNSSLQNLENTHYDLKSDNYLVSGEETSMLTILTTRVHDGRLDDKTISSIPKCSHTNMTKILTGYKNSRPGISQHVLNRIVGPRLKLMQLFAMQLADIDASLLLLLEIEWKNTGSNFPLVPNQWMIHESRFSNSLFSHPLGPLGAFMLFLFKISSISLVSLWADWDPNLLVISLPLHGIFRILCSRWGDMIGLDLKILLLLGVWNQQVSWRKYGFIETVTCIICTALAKQRQISDNLP